MIFLGLIAASMLSANTPSAAAQPGADKVVCKHVVSADSGARPVKMCATRTEWAAREAADAKNPNRVVCKYERDGASRFKSYKVCMSASEWENQRQLERQQVDRIQMSTCHPGAGCR